MPKTCLKPGCNYPVFAKSYCRYHQWCRDDYKPYRYVKKPTGELDVFKDIWKTRKHVSFLSGIPLGVFDVSYFAHVLSKAQNKYPKFILHKPNIILLTPQEHFLLDHGNEEQRKIYEKIHGCSFDKIYELKNKLLIEYTKKYA